MTILIAAACSGGSPTPASRKASQKLQADPEAPWCGFDIVAPPDPAALDPCVDSPEVAGVLQAQVIVRVAGQPETFSFPFHTEMGGAICVVVANSGIKGAIHVDGKEVIPQSSLARPMLDVQGTATLGAGAHVLSARVTGKPGTSAEVSVRYLRGDLLTPPHHPVTGPAGMLTVRNLRADPVRITPDNENGIDDDATIWATAYLHNWPGSLQAHEVTLRYSLDVWQAEGCDKVRHIIGTLPVYGEQVSYGLAPVWDGKDSVGDWVPTGSYYYSLYVQLVRRHGEAVELLDEVQTQVQGLEVRQNDGYRSVEIANLDDHDGKLDLVCVRSRRPVERVTFSAYEFGQLNATTTLQSDEADLVRTKFFYTEYCFRDLPTHANPVPDSEIELEVELFTPPDVVLLPPTPIPPPPAGSIVAQSFSRGRSWLYSEFVQPGQSLTVRTVDTDIGDPMILLIELPVTFPTYPLQNDDNANLDHPHEAEVTYWNHHSEPRNVAIFILPAENGLDGVTDVELSFSPGETRRLHNMDFGGVRLSLGQQAREQIHVAPVPGGLRNYTAMILEPLCDHPESCWWDGSVVRAMWGGATPDTIGPRPLLASASASRKLFIAPQMDLSDYALPAARRTMRVMSNDVAMDPTADVPDHDPDGDGVGYLLERSAGTCDQPNQITRDGFDCSVVWNLADTDGDGLSDAWELFGVPAAETQDPERGHGVPLPYYGADPRHKDMFVELDQRGDYEPASTETPNCVPQTPPDPTDPDCNEWKRQFTPCHVEHVAAVYMTGGAADLLNPNGEPGVRLHFDLGVHARDSCGSPPRQPCLDDPSLCGDWGGSGKQVTQTFDPSTGVIRSPTEQETRERAFTKKRWGIFRHAYNTGLAASTGPGDMFGAPYDPSALAHEMGHTLGLQHHGVFDASVDNCKPHYVSIMNYMYMGDPRAQRFSGGEHLWDPVVPGRLFSLNSARLCEGFGIGPNSYPLVPSPPSLTDPFTIQGKYNILVEPRTNMPDLTQGAVDWNRDGVIQPASVFPGCDLIDASVPGFLNFVGGNTSCDQGHFRTFPRLATQDGFGVGAPAIVRVPERGLGVIYHDSAGGMSARFHPSNLNNCRDFQWCPAADPAAPPKECTPGEACGDFDPIEVVLLPHPTVDLSRFGIASLGPGLLVVAPGAVPATEPSMLWFSILLYNAEQGRWEGSWSPLHDAFIGPTHRPVLVAHQGEHHAFFWGDDDRLKHFRLSSEGTWSGSNLLVINGFGIQPVEVNPDVLDEEPGSGRTSSVRIDPAATVVIEQAGGERMYLAVRARLDPSLTESDPMSYRVHLLEHSQHLTNRWLWNGRPDGEAIRERLYECDHSVSPPDCSTFSALHSLRDGISFSGYYRPASNLSLAYITEDRIPDAEGSLAPFPGRLMLTFVLLNGNPRVSYSAPGDYFGLWMRSGYASNTFLHLVAADEPGGRATLSLFAEPGVDANPRGVFKVARTPQQIDFWPFADGVRDAPQYDHNDWPVIRHRVCWEIVLRRCQSSTWDESCPLEAQRALAEELCGDLARSDLPPGLIPPLTEYPRTVKP